MDYSDLKHRFQPSKNADSFGPALAVYFLISMGSLGMLAPLAIVVGAIHYVIYRTTR